MAEAEVALRLAFYLLEHPSSDHRVRVAIDGAQVRVSGADIFPIATFLEVHEWAQVETTSGSSWQGAYEKQSKRIEVHARSGVGDVVGRLGRWTVRAECKKGPLILRKGNPEYKLVREALGQILTMEDVADDDVLVVAVPKTERFRTLANKWQSRPLLRRTGIRFALVGRDGSVEGIGLE